jgi:hypothetical protein
MSTSSSWRSQASEGARGEAIVKALLEAQGATVRQATGNHPQWDLEATWPDGSVHTFEVKTQLRSEHYGSVLVETEVRDRPDGIRHPSKSAMFWAFVSGSDGRTPNRVTIMASPELARHVDHVEATRGLSRAPSGSHPGRGARVFFRDVDVIGSLAGAA